MGSGGSRGSSGSQQPIIVVAAPQEHQQPHLMPQPQPILIAAPQPQQAPVIFQVAPQSLGGYQQPAYYHQHSHAAHMHYH